MSDGLSEYQRHIERVKIQIPENFQLSPQVKTTQEHLQVRERCILVGKGPSLAYANQHRSYGHVATINEACLQLEGGIDYAFFYDQTILENARPAWPRIRTFVMSALLYTRNKAEPRIAITDIQGLPLDRVLTFYDSQHPWDFDQIAASTAAGRFLNVDTAVTGLHFLVLAGYKDILLIGHDGGRGYAAGMVGLTPQLSRDRDFQRFRELMECVAGNLVQYHNVTIRFFDGKTICPQPSSFLLDSNPPAFLESPLPPSSDGQ